MTAANPAPVIWISAGEASGDVHAALLAKAMTGQHGPLAFRGIGGPALEAAGMVLDHHIRDISVMGFTEVFAHLPRILGILRDVWRKLRELRPAAVILVDAPDFNFLVMRMAKSLGIPAYYFISPQVWAWRTYRVHSLRRNCRKVLCILPFEPAFYARHGVEAEFIGHPLVEDIPLDLLDAKPRNPNLVGLLPGSRRREVAALLPLFVRAARLLGRRYPHLRFKVSRAPGMAEEAIRAHLPADLPVEVAPPEERHMLMREASVLLCASGTAVLEAAVIGTPTLAAYTVSPVTYRLGRLIIDCPYMTLPNLILGREAVPEFLQENARAWMLAAKAEQWLMRPDTAHAARTDLAELRGMLGEPGSAERAARIILADLFPHPRPAA